MMFVAICICEVGNRLKKKVLAASKTFFVYSKKRSSKFTKYTRSVARVMAV